MTCYDKSLVLLMHSLARISNFCVVDSDVPAWLGLEAGAWAWLMTAGAYRLLKPGHGVRLGLGLGLRTAWAGACCLLYSKQYFNKAEE